MATTYKGRNYPGHFVETGPQFPNTVQVDRWIKSNAICVDPPQLNGKYHYASASDISTDEHGINTRTFKVLSRIVMNAVAETPDGHFHFVGVDRFDGESVGIWLDVVKGQPRQPGWGEVLGFTDNTFYDEID